jgi:hypothetical protein
LWTTRYLGLWTTWVVDYLGCGLLGLWTSCVCGLVGSWTSWVCGLVGFVDFGFVIGIPPHPAMAETHADRGGSGAGTTPPSVLGRHVGSQVGDSLARSQSTSEPGRGSRGNARGHHRPVTTARFQKKSHPRVMLSGARLSAAEGSRKGPTQKGPRKRAHAKGPTQTGPCKVATQRGKGPTQRTHPNGPKPSGQLQLTSHNGFTPQHTHRPDTHARHFDRWLGHRERLLETAKLPQCEQTNTKRIPRKHQQKRET